MGKLTQTACPTQIRKLILPMPNQFFNKLLNKNIDEDIRQDINVLTNGLAELYADHTKEVQKAKLELAETAGEAKLEEEKE